MLLVIKRILIAVLALLAQEFFNSTDQGFGTR